MSRAAALAGPARCSVTHAFDPSKFHDHYIEALHRIIEKKKKSKGKAVLEDVAEPETAGSNVIDLMAALKRSVGGKAEAEPKKKAAAAKKPAARKAPAKKAAPARKRA